MAIAAAVPPTHRFAGDDADLEEMLGNLLDNACKWAQSRVSVEVIGGRSGAPKAAQTVHIIVDDDGPGLSPSERERVAKRGRRLDETKPGWGLGLSIGEPLYVVKLEPEGTRVIVGPRQALGCARAELCEVNWLGEAPMPAGGIDVQVKHRAREPAAAARLLPGADGSALVAFAEPQAGVAPGQACVFYDGTRMLGGGWIERAPLVLEQPVAGAPERALAAASGA